MLKLQSEMQTEMKAHIYIFICIVSLLTSGLGCKNGAVSDFGGKILLYKGNDFVQLGSSTIELRLLENDLVNQRAYLMIREKAGNSYSDGWVEVNKYVSFSPSVGTHGLRLLKIDDKSACIGIMLTE